MRFECDFKCGEVSEVFDRTSLNHAHVPMGWNKIYREPTGYMHTDVSTFVPYILCPRCYRIFEILAVGYTSPSGKRFRAYVESFLQAEKALETDPPNLLVNATFDEDVEDSDLTQSRRGCPMPGCNLPPGHGHGFPGGGAW